MIAPRYIFDEEDGFYINVKDLTTFLEEAGEHAVTTNGIEGQHVKNTLEMIANAIRKSLINGTRVK